MPVLNSKLDKKDSVFQQNKNDMLETLDELQALYDEAAEGGGEEAVARLRTRGKMPIRERIAHVLDRDSPFLEISPLAAWRSSYDIGSGFVVGIGVIEGVECVILGHDPSVRAGAFNPFNAKKLMRGLEIAGKTACPTCNLLRALGRICAAGGGDGATQTKRPRPLSTRPRSLCRIRSTVLRNF